MIKSKNIIFTSFLLCFIAFSTYAQQDNQLLEEAKKESEKASKYLNIDQEQEVLLYKVIFSYKSGKALINSADHMSESEKEDYLQIVERDFKSNVKYALGGDEQLIQDFFTYYEKQQQLKK